MAGKIKCDNCGEIDEIYNHTDDDEYTWDETSNTYKLSSNFPMQSEVRCAKCDSPVSAEFLASDIIASDEGGDIDGKEEDHSAGT